MSDKATIHIPTKPLCKLV